MKLCRCHADTRRVKRGNRAKPISASISAPNLVPNSLAVPGQRFVARQPILDRSQKVFGYELLFRNGIEDYFNADPELAARSTLDSSLLFGMNTLCDNTSRLCELHP